MLAAVVICMTTACGCRNDSKIEYSLNGVITKVIEAGGCITLEIEPVMDVRAIGNEFGSDGSLADVDSAIPSAYRLVEFNFTDVILNGNGKAGLAEDYGKGMYFFYIDGCLEMTSTLTYELCVTRDNYENIYDLVNSAGNKILKFTVDDGRICALEETGYRFIEKDYVYSDYIYGYDEDYNTFYSYDEIYDYYDDLDPTYAEEDYDE